MTKPCGYNDCFKCPLKDCIVNGTFADEPNVSDYVDTPKLSQEEIKAKKREYMRSRYKKRKATA